MKIYTMNQHGRWELLNQLRSIVNAKIAQKLNWEIRYGGIKKSSVLAAYESQVTEAYQRGMDSGERTECEIGQFETRSGNPEFVGLDDLCFDCDTIED